MCRVAISPRSVAVGPMLLAVRPCAVAAMGMGATPALLAPILGHLSLLVAEDVALHLLSKKVIAVDHYTCPCLVAEEQAWISNPAGVTGLL